MGGECGTYRGEDKFIQGLVENPENNRPLEIPRWEDNIKIGHQEVGWGVRLD
jgi:hypothetical protein